MRVAATEVPPVRSTPHLSPLPLTKGRGETDAMGRITSEHYGIALKSYGKFTAGSSKSH